jgi:hypothetical protein
MICCAESTPRPGTSGNLCVCQSEERLYFLRHIYEGSRNAGLKLSRRVCVIALPKLVLRGGDQERLLRTEAAFFDGATNISQPVSQRWPNLRPAGARKSSQSENRQRCAPPTPISTLTFFRSWGCSASTKWAPRISKSSSHALHRPDAYGIAAGEALGLQWPDIDFHHKCIHVHRSAWYGKAQSTKSKASAAPVTLPDALANVLREYRSIWTANPEGWLFATRNDRPPSSNKVVEYRLWPILDIPRCGLHAFRHSLASFIVDADYSPEVAKQQLRHTDARTTLNYIHLRGGITEKAMADVSNSLKLDEVGRGQGKGSQYIQ